MSDLVLVECKLRPITLRDLSQTLGYARVALPWAAYLFSQGGVSSLVQALLTTYGRWDILDYYHQHGHQPRRLTLARWDAGTHAPDAAWVLPPGAL
ncbi:MAG: hypothetical protein ACK4K2_03780 [Dehalococcoidia bacterium]